jgi:serine/threonine protein kinase
MSANSDNLQRSYADQLSDLEDRLGSLFDDEAMLAEIHVAIRGLLSNNGASEAAIREVLQKRLAAGELRRESFELVQKMLDRILTENASAAPLENEPAPQEEVPHVDTEVIVDETPFVSTEVIVDETPFAATEVTANDSPYDATLVIGTSTDEKTANVQIQVGSVLRDRFLLQQQVVGGGKGVVYKALDQRLAEAGDENTHVAIKLLPAELSRNDNALRALQQEVAKGRCLAHPNIVRFIDLDREEDQHFIVMEWLEGKTLTSILDESSSQKIDLETALDIIKQVSLALDYAHQRGVVHGDISPANVRITPEGEVKLFDFGVARILQKERDAQPDFDPAELGPKSPEYSSMQVLTGEDPVPTDDVFSLGCLMYRLIAGYRVFGPRSAAEAASEGMEPQQPQGLNNTQWLALKKALAYSRVPRFKSPIEFLAAFGELPKSQGAQAAPPPQAAPAVEPVQAPPAKAPQPEPIAQAAQAVPPAQAPQPAPTVSAPQPESLAQATQPAPTAQAPQPEPIAQAPQPEPIAQAPQPEPIAQATQPAPTAQAPQPAPAAQGPKPGLPVQSSAPAPLVIPDEPMVALRYPDDPPRSPWRLAILGIMLIASVFAGIKMDLIEKIEALIPLVVSGSTAVPPVQQDTAPEEIARVTPQASDEPVVDESGTESIVDGPPVEDIFDEQPLQEPVAESAAPETTVGETGTAETTAAENTTAETEAAEAAEEPEIDQAALLPPTLTVGLVTSGQFVPEADLTLRENSKSATIDLVRTRNMLEPYSVLLEEVGFSGNRSPWEEGQYEIANNGVATFAAGQNRVRTSISMAPDLLREADREVTIQVREIDNAESELARINLVLEDDDRRVFEASLPLNTVAFAASEVFVSEADPAVQIDVVRFKPDNRPFEVTYVIGDINATAGEDYFPPGLPIVYFGPGQRTARILIPLVQDADIEGGEVFALELRGAGPQIDPDIYQRIAVMIRDDD